MPRGVRVQKEIEAPGRKENDFYPTPDALALAICDRLKKELPQPKHIVEPSAGTGAFVRAARTVWGKEVPITAVEIDEAMREPLVASGANYLAIKNWEEIAADGFEPGTLVAGNPPFSLAVRHIKAALQNMCKGDYLAFLLRMSFTGSFDRIEFWRDYPAHSIIPIVPRPGFIGGKSDNSEYGVYIWQAGFYTQRYTQMLPHLVWRERS